MINYLYVVSGDEEMNRFDKEDKIIEYLKYIDKQEIAIFPKSKNSEYIINSILNDESWKKWCNSSGKSDLPPDYYNNEQKVMMDIMRIDDHAFINEKGKVINPTNKKESELLKELSSKNSMLQDAAIDGRLIVIADSGLRGYEDHNYDFYVNNFNRVVNKHIEKIPLYRNNHPGFKTIFMIFDESSPYFENFDLNYEKFTKVGQCKRGFPHFWWIDNNFLNCVKNSSIDYLIWITPYKHFDSLEKAELPQVIVCDLSKYPYDELKKYNKMKMESLEI